jgi:hypothetical protein
MILAAVSYSVGTVRLGALASKFPSFSLAATNSIAMAALSSGTYDSRRTCVEHFVCAGLLWQSSLFPMFAGWVCWDLLFARAPHAFLWTGDKAAWAWIIAAGATGVIATLFQLEVRLHSS